MADAAGVEPLKARRAPEHSARSERVATLMIALTSSTAYSLSYFWRYPLFMLPDSIARTYVATLFGATFDLQAAWALALPLGFGAAKLPAAAFATSHLFFRHRLASINALLVSSMLTAVVPPLVFAASPATQVAGVLPSAVLLNETGVMTDPSAAKPYAHAEQQRSMPEGSSNVAPDVRASAGPGSVVARGSSLPAST